MQRIFYLWLTMIAVLCTTTATAQELDKYGGTTAIKGKATGFFHIEQIDGIDPSADMPEDFFL